jgi:hypothetical protein
MTVDEELGLVYLPVESPTSDFYGGERPGDNLFGESLVCVDLKTGKRKWHFQIVHHPIWDYDLSSAPILADINVERKGHQSRGVAQKEAFLYVFDRVTGKPVWPIEERPCRSPMCREKRRRPRSLFPPSRPLMRAISSTIPDDLIDFHAGDAGAGQGRRRALQDGTHVPSAGGRRCQWISGGAESRQCQRRHQLAGRGLRSGNAHRIRAGPSIGSAATRPAPSSAVLSLVITRTGISFSKPAAAPFRR